MGDLILDPISSTALEIPEQYRRAGNRKRINWQAACISNIPNEILSMIFKIGLAQASHSTQDDSYSSDTTSNADSVDTTEDYNTFEVTVSHVTTHWRSVAISTPLLWTAIDVSPIQHPGRLAAYIERSKDVPLLVRLQLSIYHRLSNPTVMISMLDGIILHAHRWKRCSVSCDTEMGDVPLLGRLCGLAAPLLEHLSLIVGNMEHPEILSSDSHPRLIPQSLIGGAPRLTFVRLCGLSMYYFRPPMTAVTTLHLEQTNSKLITYSRFCDIVTASPFLINLSVYGDITGMEMWPPLGAPVISIPSLRSLRICGLRGLVYTSLLLSIIAPNLDSLVLKDAFDSDLEALWNSPRATIFPHLHTLTFYNLDFREDTYRHVFRVFPSVTHFTSILSASSVTPMILHILGGVLKENSVSSLIDPPWPLLHTLAVMPNIDDISMIDNVVESRRALGSPLVKLRLLTRFSISGMRCIVRLRDRVEVERIHEVDPWPEGLDYLDEDDHLF